MRGDRCRAREQAHPAVPLNRYRFPELVEQTMAKHLPDPAGRPDVAARRIIDMIHHYRDTGDPLTTCHGLRHIYHAAELAWDASVARAKTEGVTYREIQEATGDALGTLQGRIRSHHERSRGAVDEIDAAWFGTHGEVS